MLPSHRGLLLRFHWSALNYTTLPSAPQNECVSDDFCKCFIGIWSLGPSLSALSDICKHSPELAQAVVDGGAVAYVAPLILSPDGKLKRQVCSCLAQICKHSVDLAEATSKSRRRPYLPPELSPPNVRIRWWWKQRSSPPSSTSSKTSTCTCERTLRRASARRHERSPLFPS